MLRVVRLHCWRQRSAGPLGPDCQRCQLRLRLQPSALQLVYFKFQAYIFSLELSVKEVKRMAPRGEIGETLCLLPRKNRSS